MILGRSREDRAVEAIRLGPPGEGGLLVFGAIHGDEPASAELCRRFAEAQRGAAVLIPIWILPVLNPDGLAEGHKDNAHGVDLNRNFPARSWSPSHPPGYDPGAAPLSEPETRILARLIEDARPRVIVAVHQPLRCVNWDGPAAALAGDMSEASGYPARASVGYPTPGSFGSMYGLDRGLPVVTLELPRLVSEDDHQGCLRAVECAKIEAAARESGR